MTAGTEEESLREGHRAGTGGTQSRYEGTAPARDLTMPGNGAYYYG